MARRGGSTGATGAAAAGAGAPARTRRDRAGRAPPAEPADAPARRLDLSTTPLRPLVERPHLAAALLLALPVLAYLWPVLLGGKILSPISILYGLTPWRPFAPKDVYDYYNFTLVDIAAADYPWRVFAREMIHSGTFPAWDPHVFAGTPFFSNPQTGIFSPFNVPLWVLPLNYALGLSAALKLWAGAFGTYLVARQLRLGFLPGLLGGVAFAFSALNIVWLTHETLPGVAVMLPWAVWCVERIFERGRPGSAIGLAVATAIGLGGGHPGMQVHLLAAIAAYAVLRAAFMRDAEISRRLRPLAFVGGALAVSVLLMGVMLVPEALSSRGTIGTAARAGGRGTLPGTTMPFYAIRTVVFPDWWGRASAVQGSQPPDLPNFNERTFYPGAVALLLAFVGLLAAGGWRRKAPFALLGFVGLAIPLHAPGLYWLATHLPVFELVQSQRLHFLFAFAVAVLAAFGLQAVLERPVKERRRLTVPLCGLLVALVALMFAGVKPGDAGHTVKHFLTGKDFHRSGVLALTSVAWFTLFVVAVGVALLAARRWPRRVGAIASALVLLAALDALHFAHGYQPMGPASKVIPPRTPAIVYLQQHAKETRIGGLNYAVTNDWSLIYGLDDIRGYDPPFPTARYLRLWQAANPAQTDWQPFSLSDLGANTAHVSAALGARYLVTNPEAGSAQRVGVLRRVYNGKDAMIYANEQAAPRAMVASTVVPSGSEEETRGTILEEGFDPRHEAIVERSEPADVGALATGASVHGTATIAHEENSSVTLRASLDRRGLVVLNDQLTDGWSVKVDGRAAPVLRVNDVMRGVVVPVGRHEVRWSYAVPGLRFGLLLSLLSFAGLIGSGIALAVRARRE